MAKIMALDDSMADLKFVDSVLSAQHRVIITQEANGIEARIKEEKPDVFLLDVVMPSRNGYEVLRALKRDAETKGIPVIVISSKGERTDVEWGKRQGADGYLPKPYTPEALVSSVNSLLNR